MRLEGSMCAKTWKFAIPAFFLCPLSPFLLANAVSSWKWVANNVGALISSTMCSQIAQAKPDNVSKIHEYNHELEEKQPDDITKLPKK